VVIATSLAIVLAWCAYVVRIGGDFIEFRFMAPIVPYLVLLICWATQTLVTSDALRWVMLGLVVLGSLHHALAFGSSIRPNCLYRPAMRVVAIPGATDEPVLWSEREVGEYLGTTFAHDPSVTVAVGAAGVIPFFSKLGAIDIMGLTDRWVARNGTPLRFEQFIGGLYPGHVRLATVRYLADRRAHLFIGPGTLTRNDYADALRTVGDVLTAMFLGDRALARSTRIGKRDFPADAQVVFIPVRPGYKLVAVYLTRHPRVDAAIAAGKWRTVTVADLGE
jgi:hypothetical protein